MIGEAKLHEILAHVREDIVHRERLVRVVGIAAIAGLVFSAVRGVFAIVFPLPDGAAAPLAVAIAVTVGLCLALLGWAWHLHGGLERLRQNRYALEVAREAILHETSPIVDVHPYRAAEAPRRLVVLTARPAGTPSWLPQGLALALGVIGVVVSLTLLGGGDRPARQHWTFTENANTEAIGLSPSALERGTWTLEEHEAATGARALVNREGEEGAAATLVGARWLRDMTAVTRCKTASGHAAEGCGIVFRFRDDANYEVVRIDTWTHEAIFESVTGGVVHEHARVPADASPGVWHELEVVAAAGLVKVGWNGRPLLRAPEKSPAVSGRVGLWSPALGVTWFDELTVEPLPDAARPLEILPFVARSRS